MGGAAGRLLARCRELERSAERIGGHGKVNLYYSIALMYRRKLDGGPRSGREAPPRVGQTQTGGATADLTLEREHEVGGVRCSGLASLSHLAGATPPGSRPLQGPPAIDKTRRQTRAIPTNPNLAPRGQRLSPPRGSQQFRAAEATSGPQKGGHPVTTGHGPHTPTIRSPRQTTSWPAVRHPRSAD